MLFAAGGKSHLMRSTRTVIAPGRSKIETSSVTRPSKVIRVPESQHACREIELPLDRGPGEGRLPEPIRLHKQFCLHRRCIPDPGGNEVVQLIAFPECKPLRHLLNALAIARTDQSRHVERAHPSPP